MLQKIRTYPHLLLLIAALQSVFSLSGSINSLAHAGGAISILSILINLAMSVCVIAATVIFILLQLEKISNGSFLMSKIFTVMAIGYLASAVIPLINIFKYSGVSLLTVAISLLLCCVDAAMFFIAGLSIGNGSPMPAVASKILRAGLVCYAAQALVCAFISVSSFSVTSTFYGISLFVAVYLIPSFLNSGNSEAYAFNRKNNKIFLICLAIMLILNFVTSAIQTHKYSVKSSSRDNDYSYSSSSGSSKSYPSKGYWGSDGYYHATEAESKAAMREAQKWMAENW